MTKAYILIDDEAQAAAPADSYTDELMAVSGGELVIETHRPDSLQSVLEFIAHRKPDGLLLDIALTNALTSDDTPLAYDGIALAQQIRTLQTRALSRGAAGLPEFPLIRFSKKDVVQEYVRNDTTSDDLFDEKIDKAEVLVNSAQVAKRAFALATDYPNISAYSRAEQTDESLAALLGCPFDFLARLDGRILLGLRREGAPAHVLSRYLINALFARPGPLIDEGLLAVRLGIDREQSTGWSILVAELTEAAYTGAFQYGYPRWWMQLVLDWWSSEINEEEPLYRLGADERVRALARKERFGSLVALPQDSDSPGLKFWHRCARSGRPVDPSFGYALMAIWGQETWQDSDYLCLEEAKRDSRNPRLRSAERTRLATS